MTMLNGRVTKLEQRVPLTQYERILAVMRDCPPLPHEAAGVRAFLFDAECSESDVASFDAWFERVDALAQLEAIQ
jgi:hypothetical protein